MRFAFILQHQNRWPVVVMCRLLKVARSGFYAWRKHPESSQTLRRKQMTKMIQLVHAESRRTYGSPRMHRRLAALGYRCCVNFVAKLMRVARIVAKTRRKFKCTTDSRHTLPIVPNLLKHNFSPQQKNQVWVTDIAFVPTREENHLTQLNAFGAQGSVHAVAPTFARYGSRPKRGRNTFV